MPCIHYWISSDIFKLIMEIKNARIARKCLMRGDYKTAERLLDGMEDSLDPNVIAAFYVLYRYYMECLDLEHLYGRRLDKADEVELYDDLFTDFWNALEDEDHETMRKLAELGVPMAVYELGHPSRWEDGKSETDLLHYYYLAADMGVSRACREIG